MNIDTQIKNDITRGDIILIVSVVLLSAVLFISSFLSENENLIAEIYVNGDKAHSIALSEVEESYTLRENYCELLIEKDGVSFTFSACGDKLCIKKGKLTKPGDTMACVPEKVVVVLKGAENKDIDSVAY